MEFNLEQMLFYLTLFTSVYRVLQNVIIEVLSTVMMNYILFHGRI